jgi:hypothetical protein
VQFEKFVAVFSTSLPGQELSMRNIQTYITHILWDEEEPDVLRGSLHRVTKDQVETFKNQEALVVLLQEMMRHPAEDTNQEPAGGSIDLKCEN